MSPKVTRTLAEILADPAASAPPVAVVPGLAWRGRTTLLAAREKVGKSTFAAAAAAAVSAGSPFLGQPLNPAPAVWVGLEEHRGDWAARAQRFCSNPDKLHLMERGRASVLDDLRTALKLAPALVVVDTLAALVEGLLEDAHSSTEWTPIMAKLARLTRTSNAALLLLHHARKSDGAYRDSTAIGAGVDVIVEMSASDREAGVRDLSIKGRLAPATSFSVRLTGDSYALVSGELDLETRALEAIRRHPGVGTRDLRAILGGRNASVDEAVSRLLERRLIRDEGSGGHHAFNAAQSG